MTETLKCSRCGSAEHWALMRPRRTILEVAATQSDDGLVLTPRGQARDVGAGAAELVCGNCLAWQPVPKYIFGPIERQPQPPIDYSKVPF